MKHKTNHLMLVIILLLSLVVLIIYDMNREKPLDTSEEEFIEIPEVIKKPDEFIILTYPVDHTERLGDMIEEKREDSTLFYSYKYFEIKEIKLNGVTKSRDSDYRLNGMDYVVCSVKEKRFYPVYEKGILSYFREEIIINDSQCKAINYTIRLYD